MKTKANLPRETLGGWAVQWVDEQWGEGKKAPLLKICHTYLTMMTLGTVIPYPKRIQEIYESRETPFEFC